jgi:hypothetical protein
MQYKPFIFSLGIYATLVLFFVFLGCGVGHESSRRTVSLEGKLILTKYGAPIQVPPERYFVRDDVGDIVVEVDDSGSFFFAVIPRNGSRLQFVDSANRMEIVLPPLEDGETVRLGLRYDTGTFSLTTESVEVDSGSEATPTPLPSGGGPEIPVTQTPGVERPTPISNSPFDAQGNTSAFGIPAGLSGNITTGRRLYQQQCSSCHGEFGSGWRFSRLKTRIAQAPMFLSIPDRDLSNIIAFLNRGSR